MQEYDSCVPVIRQLKCDEMSLLHTHLLRLGQLSRTMRFNRPVSDQFIEEYCFHITSENCAVYGLFLQGVLRGSVEIRFRTVSDASEAELTLSVEDLWQKAGLGTVLVADAFSTARTMEITKVCLVCLRENYPMRRVLAKTAARFRTMTSVRGPSH